MPMPDPAHITSARKLAAAILTAPRGDVAAQVACEQRARELGREDLIPKRWATERAAAKRPSAEPTLLEQPVAALGTLERRADYDLAIRTLASAAGISYPDALSHMQEAARRGETVRAALGRGGLHDPAAELRTLELRDRAVTRTLDASLVGLTDERVDARGRVRLEHGFDVDGVLADELARTRRWKRAAAHERTYAQSREQFEQDDQLHLESGLDICRTLERAPQLAAARMRASAVGETVDGIIEAGREPASRVRELDAAIEELSGERARIAPTAGSATPTEPPKRAGAATRFVELSGGEMSRALELYDETDHRISLDECAARVSGAAAAKPATPTPAAGDGRAQLHARILTHQLENGGSYLQALEALTGVEAAGPTDSPR